MVDFIDNYFKEGSIFRSDAGERTLNSTNGRSSIQSPERNSVGYTPNDQVDDRSLNSYFPKDSIFRLPKKDITDSLESQSRTPFCSPESEVKRERKIYLHKRQNELKKSTQTNVHRRKLESIPVRKPDASVEQQYQQKGKTLASFDSPRKVENIPRIRPKDVESNRPVGAAKSESKTDGRRHGESYFQTNYKNSLRRISGTLNLHTESGFTREKNKVKVRPKQEQKQAGVDHTSKGQAEDCNLNSYFEEGSVFRLPDEELSDSLRRQSGTAKLDTKSGFTREKNKVKVRPTPEQKQTGVDHTSKGQVEDCNFNSYFEEGSVFRLPDEELSDSLRRQSGTPKLDTKSGFTREKNKVKVRPTPEQKQTGVDHTSKGQVEDCNFNSYFEEGSLFRLPDEELSDSLRGQSGTPKLDTKSGFTREKNKVKVRPKQEQKQVGVDQPSKGQAEDCNFNSYFEEGSVFRLPDEELSDSLRGQSGTPKLDTKSGFTREKNKVKVRPTPEQKQTGVDHTSKGQAEDCNFNSYFEEGSVFRLLDEELSDSLRGQSGTPKLDTKSGFTREKNKVKVRPTPEQKQTGVDHTSKGQVEDCNFNSYFEEGSVFRLPGEELSDSLRRQSGTPKLDTKSGFTREKNKVKVRPTPEQKRTGVDHTSNGQVEDCNFNSYFEEESIFRLTNEELSHTFGQQSGTPKSHTGSESKGEENKMKVNPTQKGKLLKNTTPKCHHGGQLESNLTGKPDGFVKQILHHLGSPRKAGNTENDGKKEDDMCFHGTYKRNPESANACKGRKKSLSNQYSFSTDNLTDTEKMVKMGHKLKKSVTSFLSPSLKKSENEDCKSTLENDHFSLKYSFKCRNVDESVGSLANASYETCWVSFQGSKKILRVDNHGTIKDTVKVERGVDDIASDGEDNLYISLSNMRGIIVYRKREVRCLVSFCDFSPCGIAYHPPSTSLAVCLYSHKTAHDTYTKISNGKVKLYSTNTNKPEEKRVTEKDWFPYPVRVAVNRNDDIIVTDLKKRSVVSITSTGNKRFDFRGCAEFPIDEQLPSIACDRRSNIYIISKDGDVCLMDPNGNLLCIISIPISSSCINAALFDNNGYLWIGCDNGNVFIFSCKKGEKFKT